MRSKVILLDGIGEDQDVSGIVAEEELVIRQYCSLIGQICGAEDNMLHTSWRTKV